MKKHAIACILTANLFIFAVQEAAAGSVSCPDIPAGTYGYMSGFGNGWLIAFGKGQSMTIPKDLKWSAQAGNGMQYVVGGAGGGPRAPVCINNVAGVSLLFNTQQDYHCAKDGGGSLSEPSWMTQNCATNSFVAN